MIKLKHRPETLNQEKDLVKEYVESLPPGEVFFDLGACVGTYSLLAYERGLNVIAFEVDEVNYNAMVENIMFNFENYGVNDLFHFNIGIADKEGELELRIGQPEIGGHHKTLNLDEFCGHPSSFNYLYPTKKVKVDSLDNIVKKEKLLYPNHIKIDIDGSEYAFIHGAEKCLKFADSIIIELYDKNEYFEKIMDILQNKYNFKLYKTGVELEPGLKDYWFKK